MKTFVIAECASAHDGQIEQATRLLDAAVAAGADAAKFQYWSDADRLADRRHVPPVYREMYRRYQMPSAWLRELHAYCADRIEFMATTYLPEDIAVVAPFVKRFKIASFEAVDRAFIQRHKEFQKETLVSVGMMDRAQYSNFDRWVLSYVKWLACTSAYPAPIDQMNLRTIGMCGIVGLSDHSRQVDMGALAVAAGAGIIEAHIRLEDTDPDNPDYAVAFTPAEFKTYVELIRRAELIMGDGVKRPQPCEEPLMAYRVRP